MPADKPRPEGATPESTKDGSTLRDCCPHCKRPRAELPIINKSGDPRLIRTWRRMASELDKGERARFEALLEKSAQSDEGLSPGESDALERFSFQQQLANTVQSYVLCQGCHSLENAVFFSSREHLRAVLRERGW